MISPYKSYLNQFAELTNQITLTRQGAPDISGTIKEVSDFGCVIVSEKSQTSMNQIHTFVAFEDIRGVSQEQVHEELIH